MVKSNTTRPERVVVAMSGGVDSSTAAALLVDQGYEVQGVMMQLWATRDQDAYRDNRRCSRDAVSDAQRVCQLLGIPLQLVDLQAEFRNEVVDYFCDTYALGRTPNPCLACNRQIKFGILLRLALSLGAEYLATGHYARIRSVEGVYQLLRGVDRDKDQSYVLYMLGQDELAHALFPLGAYTKRQVRSLASKRGLPVAIKPESQDACFISNGDYRGFLAQQRPESARPGPILDLQGRVVGKHDGVAFYTIGQRQGLGITAAHPLYVVEIDHPHNALVVGSKRALYRRELLAEEVRYVSGKPPFEPVRVEAKIRYKAREAAAALVPSPEGKARVVFDEPQPAITPGQGVVFYQQELVLGGGIITEVGPRGV